MVSLPAIVFVKLRYRQLDGNYINLRRIFKNLTYFTRIARDSLLQDGKQEENSFVNNNKRIA